VNKIVREHYPAARLPDDLREAIGDHDEVTLTIEVTEKPPANQPDWFSRHEHIRRNYYNSDEEVVEYIRGLRDEWERRER
jgi:hypothetical protein